MDNEKKPFCDHLRAYAHKLEDRMQEYMSMEVTDRTAMSVSGMAECWEKMKAVEEKLAHCKLSEKDITMWSNNLLNANGTKGTHWTKEHTDSAAKMVGVQFGHITPSEFWIAMNMMYSDHSPVAEKFGVNKPEFYAELAKSFLFDKDGPDPEVKLAAYYRSVLTHDD